MKNSVLILGAASLQVPIIKYVKSKGFNVIVVSIPGHYPGFELADKCIYCDIRDLDGILASIKDDEIEAVLTDETESFITKKLVSVVENTGIADAEFSGQMNLYPEDSMSYKLNNWNDNYFIQLADDVAQLFYRYISVYYNRL